MKRGSHLLGDALVAAGLAASKGDARRLVTQGGVKVNGAVAADPMAAVEIGSEPVVIQKGKRHFVRLIEKKQ